MYVPHELSQSLANDEFIWRVLHEKLYIPERHHYDLDPIMIICGAGSEDVEDIDHTAVPQ